MNRFKNCQLLIVTLCFASASCNTEADDADAWRDYYQPEWATGAESLPAQVLPGPPATVEIDPELTLVQPWIDSKSSINRSHSAFMGVVYIWGKSVWGSSF